MSASLQDAPPPLEIAGQFLHEAPVDLLAMAERLGLSVKMDAALGPGISGRIRRQDNSYHIEVNGAHSLNRRRFTLAHEIAHYLLHRDLIGNGIEDDALYRSPLGGQIESEANHLAAQMLMPGPLVRNLYRNGLRSLAALCGAFQVSEEAMRIRLKQLRLAP